MKDALFNDLVQSLEQAAAHVRGETVPGLKSTLLRQPPTSSRFANMQVSPASNSQRSSERRSARFGNGKMDPERRAEPRVPFFSC